MIATQRRALPVVPNKTAHDGARVTTVGADQRVLRQEDLHASRPREDHVDLGVAVQLILGQAESVTDLFVSNGLIAVEPVVPGLVGHGGRGRLLLRLLPGDCGQEVLFLWRGDASLLH